MFFNNEAHKIIRSMFLALSILTLCYYSLQNGPMEYNILENGQILPGFVSSRRIFITFSLGYSILYSVISSVTAIMLVYSIIVKQPQFSLPLMALFLTELVYDSCYAIITIWYIFANLQLQIALFYAAGLLLLICKESLDLFLLPKKDDPSQNYNYSL